ATGISAYEGLSVVSGFAVDVVDTTRVRKEEAVTQLLVEIDVQLDGSVHVQEWVLYQSGPNGSVTLERTLGNASGFDETELLLDVDLQRVTDVDGEKIAFSHAPTQKGYTIRAVGDPAYQRQWFGFEYVVEHAFETTELADVFTWDLVGEAYDIPVREVFTTISFPEEVNVQEVIRVASCAPTYFGAVQTKEGLEERCTTTLTNENTVTMFAQDLEPHEDVRATVSLDAKTVSPTGVVRLVVPGVTADETIWVDGEETVVTAPQSFRLSPGEHTIHIEAERYVPQDSVVVVEPYQTQDLSVELRLQPLWKFLSVWFPLLLSLLGVVFVIWLWARFGKDPRGRGTIIAQYDPPPGLKPAEVGVVYDRKADTHDLTATIVWLAVHGYLKIVRTGKGKWTFEFTRTSKQTGAGSGLTAFEQEVYDGIFGAEDRKKTVKLSSLKGKFYVHLPVIQEALYTSVVEGGYFPNHPNNTPKRFVAGGLVLSVGLVVLAFVAAAYFEGVLYFLMIPVAALLFLLSFFMAKRTPLGVETLEHIKGFKLFLTTAEKDRLAFHQGPEKFTELFEEYLPFAVALQVEEEWAKRFADIYKGSPDWFVGDGMVDALVVSHMLSSIQSVSRAAFVAPPASTSSGSSWGGSSGFSGGGFSGGGFGGGGGGSW
ncbi:MAG: DUF2207 domain-containing protein, partial [Candidatus Doudnabacteria bacterium]|nr:DUF2207 domain-containing protein [Candidatus Doudnabacteria bacterium]